MHGSKRHLRAEFSLNRCDRRVLVPLLEKMTEQEAYALLTLLRNAKSDAQSRSRANMFRGVW
jgi:hypothetical protein